MGGFHSSLCWGGTGVESSHGPDAHFTTSRASAPISSIGRARLDKFSQHRGDPQTFGASDVTEGSLLEDSREEIEAGQVQIITADGLSSLRPTASAVRWWLLGVPGVNFFASPDEGCDMGSGARDVATNH